MTKATSEPGKRIPLINGDEYDYLRHRVPARYQNPRTGRKRTKNGYRRRYRRMERRWLAEVVANVVAEEVGDCLNAAMWMPFLRAAEDVALVEDALVGALEDACKRLDP